MSGNIELTPAARGYNIDACFFGLRQNGQLGMPGDLFSVDRCMAAVRSEELIVESAEKRERFIVNGMLEHTENLLIQRMFLDTVKMIHRRLSCPADVVSGSYVRTGPIEDSGQLLPIAHFFKRQ
ncbi:hypothetical protein SDC9_172474 [bioreactor metagenome]|uniref:Uncharacterized protein n=1 Tax=bioreactor metagenome TaxID=1076179 RepID=A0A645GDT5_9ZZZZ